jgi:hypothetical protein
MSDQLTEQFDALLAHAEIKFTQKTLLKSAFGVLTLAEKKLVLSILQTEPEQVSTVASITEEAAKATSYAEMEHILAASLEKIGNEKNSAA